MRCVICNTQLKTEEVVRRDHRGKYIETCNDCTTSVYKTLREFDLQKELDKQFYQCRILSVLK